MPRGRETFYQKLQWVAVELEVYLVVVGDTKALEGIHKHYYGGQYEMNLGGDDIIKEEGHPPTPPHSSSWAPLGYVLWGAETFL